MNAPKILLLFLSIFIFLACASPKKVPQNTARSTQQQPKIPNQSALKELANRPKVLAVKSRYLLKDSSMVKIFMELDVINLTEEEISKKFNENFLVNWLIVPDYGIKDRLANGKVEINQETCAWKEGKIMLSFEIPRLKNNKTGLLFTEIAEVESGKKATNDMAIDFRGTRLSDRYALFLQDKNTPISRNYINQKDTFQLRSLNATPKNIYLVRYKHEFDAAASPMSNSQRATVAKSLKVDSIFQVSANAPIHLVDEGLYLAVEDTTNLRDGYGFMVVDNRFPRLTKPEKLINPLVYMSTNQEIQGLTTNKDSKQALDLYFLTVAGGNQTTAKRIIKAYYRRVEEANRLFSTYKEGWKTDKGMIYMILGPPSRVQRGKDREVWSYSQSQNFSEIIFTFYRKPNQFTENHYELLRYPEYQTYWYPFVEAWRTGNVSE